MKKTLLAVAVAFVGSAMATPFTGNDAASNAMGNTGVASATVQNAFQFNPALLADYPENVDFGLTLPSIKFFIDDSLGLIENGEDFISGGTWEDFQNIDAAAFEAAITNTPTTIGLVQADIAAITAASTAIQADFTDPAPLIALNNASASLTTNTSQLDTDIGTINTQSANLTTAVDGTLIGLLGFNNKPLQIGLGIDILNAAIPSQKLAMALSISTTSTVGAQVNISSTDSTPVNNLLSDLNGISTEASVLTTELNQLAVANSAMTAHLLLRPDETDAGLYPGGLADGNYATDMAAWATTLDSLNATVTSEGVDVDAAMADVTNYSGNYYAAGALNAPTVGDLTSEIEFVGANITEIGVSLARKFTIKGEDVAFGVTPKLQSINIFEKTIGLANSDTEVDSISSDPAGYFLNNTTMLYRANVDVGAAKSWDFYGRVRAGVALKDIIPWTLKSKSGTELLIRPKLRVGGAHETKFTKLAVDLDITENKPLKYGVPTRYLGFGAELNAWHFISLRAGYRTNLSVKESGVVSGGFGLTPFGVGLEFSGWIKPTFDEPAKLVQDMGMVVQLSANF